MPLDIVTLQQARAQADKRYPHGVSWMDLPFGWDATWKAAKASQNTAQARIAFLGTSIGSGQFGTGQTGAHSSLDEGFVGVARAGILAKAGNTLSGDFYQAAQFYTGVGLLSGSMPFSTYTGSMSIDEGGYGRVAVLPNGQTTNVTYTTRRSDITAIDIVYVDYGSGTWTYTVDGGSAQTVTTTGPGTQFGTKLKKVSITGLSAGTHTLAIGNLSANAVCKLVGIAEYKSKTSGIAFARSTWQGGRIVDLATNGGSATGSGGTYSYPPDKIALWSGQNPGGSSPTSMDFGFPTQPHLAVIEFPDVNSTSYGAHPLLIRATAQRLVQSLRRGVDACSILFLSLHHPDGVYGDVNAGSSGRSQQHNRFKAIAKELAGAYDCAWVDIDAKWGETANAKGFLPTNDIHPFVQGHADIGNVLASIL